MERQQADAFTRWAGKRFDRTRPRRIPVDLPEGVLLAAASLTLLLLAGEAVFGAGAVGISQDNFTHVLRFREWLGEGWYVSSSLLEGYGAGGKPDPGTPSSPFVYAPVFSVLAHLFNTALGNEGMGEVSARAGAYEVRHLVVALVGLAAVFCVGAAVRVLTRDRLAAIWSAAALLAIPVWTGNSMFNVKDIPVASGFTFVTVGLLLGLAWARRGSWPSSRRLLAVSGLVALGTLIGVGTRPAMWVPFVCSLSAYAALSWLMLRSTDGVLRSLAAPAVGLLVGLGGVAALYPYAAATPIDWLFGSVSDSSGYEGGHETLTAGEFLGSTDPPLWYLPAWIFAGVPVIIFGLAAAGGVVVVRHALRWRSSGRESDGPSRAQVGGMLLVMLQLVLLPTAAIVAGSSMYSGLRQHLYVLPAVAILAGIGAAKGLQATRAREVSPRLRLAAALVLALALAVPAIEQTRLYPYNYVYVNPIAGLGGVQGRWETELQFISSREAFHRIPSNVEPSCSSSLVPAQGATPRPMITPCLELPPFRDEVGDEATTSATEGETWVVGRTRSDNHPPEYCQQHDNVTRSLRTENLVMAYVLRCIGEEAGTPNRTGAAGARRASRGDATLVREPTYRLALPRRWTRVDPPPGAEFSAALRDGWGETTLWVENDPGLGLKAFQKRSIDQLREFAANVKIAKRVGGPTREQSTVRLSAEGLADSGVDTYEATLRASGPYRYFLLTMLSPEASGIAREDTELIHRSFVPRVGVG